LADAPKLSAKQRAAAATAAACLVCVPLTASFEGLRTRPYRDPANIVTWCYGETQGPRKQVYTASECATLLENRLATKYGPKVLECMPELSDPRTVNVFAALLDASYNAGPVAVCLSPMATKVRGDDVKGACSAFTARYVVEGMVTPGWFTTARYRGPAKPAAAMRRAGWTWTGKNWRKILPGLVTRRQKEMRLCLS
jgi:GH24 family phage-related lysozyme (muramidase)